MKTLVEILITETSELKEIYIEKTIAWANSHYEHLESFKKYSEVDWCKYFHIEPEVKYPGTASEYSGFPRGFYNTSKARELRRIQDEVYGVTSKGLEGFVSKEVSKAELHYKQSIEKLAARIEKKGLITENLTVKTGRVGINIETVLTDGVKTVKAFTIVAEGEIQRPHYRYLIK